MEVSVVEVDTLAKDDFVDLKELFIWYSGWTKEEATNLFKDLKHFGMQGMLPQGKPTNTDKAPEEEATQAEAEAPSLDAPAALSQAAGAPKGIAPEAVAPRAEAEAPLLDEANAMPVSEAAEEIFKVKDLKEQAREKLTTANETGTIAALQQAIAAGLAARLSPGDALMKQAVETLQAAEEAEVGFMRAGVWCRECNALWRLPGMPTGIRCKQCRQPPQTSST